MKELKVGMYCFCKQRRYLGIGKILNVSELSNVTVQFKNHAEVFVSSNLEASESRIDLIRSGDYVNGLVVTRICVDEETGKKYLNLYGSLSEWENEDIKSIVTKEQFNSVKYEVE